MPVDYSRFDDIEDSDSEDGHGGGDLADFLRGAGEADSPPASPEPPRRLPDIAKQSCEDADEPPPPPTFERFALLAEGDAAVRHDDAIELLATARATLQSSLAAGEPEAATRLMQALAVGLGRRPHAVPFAREQAPELLPELLFCHASGLVPEQELDRMFDLIVARCRDREIYTFLVEALCAEELSLPAHLRGVELLRATLQSMGGSKNHMFLGSVFPVLLKRTLAAPRLGERLPEKLDVLRSFAVSFLPEGESDADDSDPGRVVQAMVTALLFKALQRSLPAATPLAPKTTALYMEPAAPSPVASTIAGNGEASSSEPNSKRLREENRIVRFRRADKADPALLALCAVARSAAASSSKPLVSLVEDMDVGDPTGDGGGDLELSPLCLAAYVCLLDLHGCWREVMPHVIPVGLSLARRANVLMRSCHVLVSNRGGPSGIISLGDASADSTGSAGGGAGDQDPCWAHRGLALFAEGCAPLLRAAAEQTPHAFSSLSGPLCRWYPACTFQAVLEALVSTPDVERDVRGALFSAVAGAIRLFAWPCRFELYLEIVRGSRVDSVIGAVVTLFKDDWWQSVQGLAARGEPLGEERLRLAKVLKATLSGDLQIVDGMDTITATLNVARLVVLAHPPTGTFLRAGLRKGGPGVALDEMLAGVSKQIDMELKFLEGNDEAGNASNELAKEIQKALGKTDGDVDMRAMKRDRIAMVAHLVARVRELLATAEA